MEIVKQGYPTVIFPEGERTLTGEIGIFKKGSFKLALDTDGSYCSNDNNAELLIFKEEGALCTQEQKSKTYN